MSSKLSALAALTGENVDYSNDDFYVNDNGVSKKITAGNLRKFITTSYNVKDYGATGDGSTDDRPAIQAAFAAAIANLPATVYFPPGDYAMAGGTVVSMTQGTGGLTICGAGPNTSRLIMAKGSALAAGEFHLILVEPSVDPTVGTYADYIHDITIKDLGFFDEDPTNHALGPDESHGVAIKYCLDATIQNCSVIDICDEGFDFNNVVRGTMVNNHGQGTPSRGAAGSVCSIGSGCKHIVVSGNNIHTSGTIGTQSTVSLCQGINVGVVASATASDIEDVVVTGNTISDAIDGIYIGTADTINNSDIKSLTISNNTIRNCDYGIQRKSSNGITYDMKVVNNTIIDSDLRGIYINVTAVSNLDCDIAFNTIDTVTGIGIAAAGTRCNFSGNNIRNTTDQAFYMGTNAIDVLISGGIISACGGGSANGDRVIIDVKASGTSSTDIEGISILDAQSVTSIVDGVRSIRNSRVESAAVNLGSRGIDDVQFVTNNVLINTGLRLVQNKSVCDGNHITIASNPSVATIRVNAVNDSSVMNNYVEVTGGTRTAIEETAGANYNNISHNNVRNRGSGTAITVVGANTVYQTDVSDAQDGSVLVPLNIT